MALDAVGDRVRRNLARPADEAGHAHAAFPGRALLAAERRVAAVGPHHQLVAVVGRVDDDRVVGDAEVLELLQQHADLLVVLDHLGADHVFFGAALVDGHLHVLLLRVRPDVDGGRVEPAEEGLVALAVAVEPVERLVEHLAVEGLHALAGEHAGVLDLLLADAAEHRIVGRIVLVGRPGVQHAARPVFLQVLGILLAGIVEFLRLFLGVEVIEVAEPFVEAVHGRQELVAVAEMVLAELAGRVALRLQHLGERRILLLDAARRTGNADRGHAGAHRHLAHDEGGAAGGAARLAVVVGEDDAFLADAVDVGRLAHHAVRVGADVPHADVVAEDDEDVRLVRLGCWPCAAPSRMLRVRSVRWITATGLYACSGSSLTCYSTRARSAVTTQFATTCRGHSTTRDLGAGNAELFSSGLRALWEGVRHHRSRRRIDPFQARRLQPGPG